MAEWLYRREGSEGFWARVDDNHQHKIEKEYQEHLSRQRRKVRTYNCFGEGGKASINFDFMLTYCNNLKCVLHYHGTRVPGRHLSYELKRLPVQDK